MLTVYKIKPYFQTLLRPLLKKLFQLGVTANQVTIFAFLISLISGLALALNPDPTWFAILPFILFIRMALNAIDGLLAREFNQQSRLGAMLNELGDVFSDIALYLPFALLAESSPAMVYAIIILAIMTEFTGVLVQTLTGSRNYAGPMGKSDRAALFGLWGVLIAFWPSLLAWNNVVWSLTLVLLVWTLINRCRAGLREGKTA